MMKKGVIVCLALGLFSNFNISAQAFQKGTINIDIGIGLAIYGTSQTSTYERTATMDPTWVSLGLVAENQFDTTIVKDNTDGAASTLIPIAFEYGVSSKIGVGVDFVFSNYFINDSDKVNLESVKAFDFGPKVYYHPLNSDFYDLSLGLGLGFTKIGWNVTNTSAAQDYSGSGFYLNLDIKNKFWFSDHIGAYVNIGYRGNFYSLITRDTAGDEAELESNAFVSNVKIKDEFTFNMSGINFGLGLAVKF